MHDGSQSKPIDLCRIRPCKKLYVNFVTGGDVLLWHVTGPEES